jgi:hypothetical protein
MQVGLQPGTKSEQQLALLSRPKVLRYPMG